ncbi:MAG: YbbR-like domain-containing protein [Leptospirales bacterium]|nr:YbbR-like domain-containing protein [Leptospirales bacterium]
MRRWLINWQLKLGSLAAAFALFGYVQYARNITRTVNVRVERPALPNGLVFSSRTPSFMSVVLRGEREMLEFDPSDFRIQLTNPLPAPGPVVYRARLSPELPEGVRAQFDQEVELIVSRLLERELPISARLISELDPGLERGYVEVRPPTVRVRGPYETVRGMTHVLTEGFTLRGRASVYTARLPMASLPEFVEVAPNQPIDVELLVNVAPATASDFGRLESVAVHCWNDIRGINIATPATVRLEFNTPGPFRPEEFSAETFCPVFLDGQEIRPSFLVSGLPVRVVDRLRRPDLQIMRVSPPSVELQFERAPLRASPEAREGFQEHVIPQS